VLIQNVRSSGQNGNDLMSRLTSNALKVLEKRYLKKDETGNVVETPSELFGRVAGAIAQAEEIYGKDPGDAYPRFLELLTSLDFLPNSPTLMNAGRPLGQLSACFVLPVEDSLNGIFETVKHAALIHKSGGGCIAGDARVWSTFCGLEPIEVLFHRTTADGRPGIRRGFGVAYDVNDLNIQTAAMDPATGSMGLRKVTHVWKFDVPAADQMTVRTREGTVIQTSAWHPFMVLRDTGFAEVRADELARGDVILGPDRPDSYWPWSEYRTAGTLTIDPWMGWLIGFTLGDGSFDYVPSLRQYRVRWFSGTRDVLERVQEVLASRDIHVAIQRDNRSTESFLLTTLSQRFVHDLLEACGLGAIGVKEDHIRVPEAIAKSPLPVVRAFLAGLLDSDGYVAKDGSPSYSTISEEFAQDLAALAALMGYRPTVSKENPRGRGKRAVFNVQVCPLPQVLQLADDLQVYLANRFRLARLSTESTRETALRLPLRAWRDRMAELGLVRLRGDKSTGPGSCAVELKRWSCNANHRCRRDDLRTIASQVRLQDPDLAALMERVAARGQEIARVGRATTPKPYYDLSVEGWNTYAAGQSGLAMVHNTGFSFSRLRPEGDLVHSTKGVSSGPVSFMGVFDAATDTIKQGGTRRGANMGILRVDHPDIEAFIVCKRDGKRFQNFNISVAITDAFMGALETGAEYALINPRDGSVVRMESARRIFELIVENAWATGDPGIVFIDRVNAKNPTPHAGQIESCNPCGEQFLLPYESCNLGSINLSNFVKDGRIDFGRLQGAVGTAVHFLDNVIDMNRYPLEEISRVTLANRKVGLGVMGFADMLILLGVPYDSRRALEIAGEVMGFIHEEAVLASRKLAKDRGPFPNFEGSVYSIPQRNAMVTTVAPTGTISIIAGCSSGIEPLFAVSYVRNVLDGHRLIEVHPEFARIAKERGFYSEALMERIAFEGSVAHVEEVPEDVRGLFVCAHDIPSEQHVRMQAAFQAHVDNAISKTVNFPFEAPPEAVEKVYLLAWEQGCKGVTIYRDGSREAQVLETGKTRVVREGGQAPLVQARPAKRKRPKVLNGTTIQMDTGCGPMYVTINEDERGLFELFNTIGKAGGCAASQSEAIGRLVSLAWRSGIPAEETTKQLIGIRCHKPVGFGDNQITSCADAIAKAVLTHLGEDKHKYQDPPSYGACPECGGTLEPKEGCATCKECGYSECE